MRTAARVLAAAGTLLVAFGWWGIETRAGQRRFDEMDGLIPFFAGVAGVGLLALAAIAFLLARRRARTFHHEVT